VRAFGLLEGHTERLEGNKKARGSSTFPRARIKMLNTNCEPTSGKITFRKTICASLLLKNAFGNQLFFGF